MKTILKAKFIFDKIVVWELVWSFVAAIITAIFPTIQLVTKISNHLLWTIM